MAWQDKVVRKRVKRAEKLLTSELSPLCKEFGIEMERVRNVVTFVYREYTITWYIRSNRIVIQYSLAGQPPVEYAKEANRGRPKIIEAIYKIAEIEEGENHEV